VLRTAEEIFWKVVGSDHPWVAMVLANEGDTLNALHRHVQARAAFEMALAIWRRQKAEPARMASSETGLGLALLGEGRPLEAIEPLDRALEARADRSTPPELVGQTRFALARAEWAKPGARSHALALARAARADYVGVAGGDSTVAAIDSWLHSPSAKL
jgi:tetratricopeptide (TPR) repeat protein